jgi:hypothetical protein
LIGGWVDLRTVLNNVEGRKILTLPGLELRPFGRPACSQAPDKKYDEENEKINKRKREASA